MGSKVEVFEGLTGDWYFRVVAANGEIVSQSEGYGSKSDAEAGSDAMRRAVLEEGEETP